MRVDEGLGRREDAVTLAQAAAAEFRAKATSYRMLSMSSGEADIAISCERVGEEYMLMMRETKARCSSIRALHHVRRDCFFSDCAAHGLDIVSPYENW